MSNRSDEDRTFRDIGFLSRNERQELYARILKEKQCVMTPSLMKEELQRRGMTFAFVGQDMASMRMMPCISIQDRGRFCWNSNFNGDVEKLFAKAKKDSFEGSGCKRARTEPFDEFVRQQDSLGGLENPKKADKKADKIAASQEESVKEKIGFHNLELLLAVAEEGVDDQRIVEM